MADQEKPVSPNDLLADDPAPPPPSSPEAEPSLVEDLRVLEGLDWNGALLKRFRLGKHPDPMIESLLRRRLDFDHHDFLEAYPIRLLCSLALVIAGSAAAWIAMWSVCSLGGFTVLLRELSWGMSFLLVCLMALVISNPIRLYDELRLDKTGSERIAELQREAGEDAGDDRPDETVGKAADKPADEALDETLPAGE